VKKRIKITICCRKFRMMEANAIKVEKLFFSFFSPKKLGKEKMEKKTDTRVPFFWIHLARKMRGKIYRIQKMETYNKIPCIIYIITI